MSAVGVMKKVAIGEGDEVKALVSSDKASGEVAEF